MIPKIIHYCWLSQDKMPDEFIKYIETWKKNLPDYEFIKWDFNKFPKGKSIWVDEAFENKKYAFAADYIRLFALYNYGGIYLDCDVEVLKSFNEFLKLKIMLGYENSPSKGLEVAVMGVPPYQEWVKKCLDFYENKHFKLGPGIYQTKVLPQVVKDILLDNQYQLIEINNIEEAQETINNKQLPIFPYYYFSPKSYETGKYKIKKETFSVHHFAGSWQGNFSIFLKLYKRFYGDKSVKFVSKILKKFLSLFTKDSLN